jgi:hypothetical protein
VASSFSPQSPAAPIFFFLPLSGRTSRVLDLEPVGRSATAIGGILPLRDDSFEPKLAGVAEHGLAVALYVVIEPNAMANPGEDAGQRRLADFERKRRRSSPFSSIRSKAYRNTLSLARW